MKSLLCVYLVLRQVRSLSLQFSLFWSHWKIIAWNNESLEEEILDVIFADVDGKEQFNGFTRAEAEEIEREFEEDDSEFEDLLADEDSASGDVSLNDIAWLNWSRSSCIHRKGGPVSSIAAHRNSTSFNISSCYLQQTWSLQLWTVRIIYYATETILDSEEKGQRDWSERTEQMKHSDCKSRVMDSCVTDARSAMLFFAKVIVSMNSIRKMHKIHFFRVQLYKTLSKRV